MRVIKLLKVRYTRNPAIKWMEYLLALSGPDCARQMAREREKAE